MGAKVSKKALTRANYNVIMDSPVVFFTLRPNPLKANNPQNPCKFQKLVVYLHPESIITLRMCTITLSYNENDSVANEKLAALLATGLFIQHDAPKELDIDYSDPSLYEEDDQMSLPEGKDSYTPEELRAMLINDLNSIYRAKDAI